jgi:hypothetical protein
MVNLQAQNYLDRALAFAASRGGVSVLRMLLEHGADATAAIGEVSDRLFHMLPAFGGLIVVNRCL